MDYFYFLGTAFLIGTFGATVPGPVFLLIFNRAARQGMRFGVATGVGAAITDGTLFFLGLSGLLSFLKDSPLVNGVLDLIGGVALCAFGIYQFYAPDPRNALPPQLSTRKLFETVIKTTMILIVNPTAILFFALVSMQFFSEQIGGPLLLSSQGALAVACGTLSASVIISFAASFIGVRLTPRMLRIFSWIMGAALVGLGLWLFLDFGRLVFSTLYQ
jgi:threonine/homoserine/homoserine lactone efflux protein